MKLFDAHCHFESAEAVERAAAAGVVGMAVCGTNSNDWKKVLQLAEGFPQIVPMVGLHPWFVGCRAGAETPPESAITGRGYNWKDDFQTLEKMVRKDPSLGIGETGLDFQNRFTNRAEQEDSFAAHLDLARELNRPVAVHCVQAWGRLVEILREHPAPRVLLHAFGGAPELIPELIALNCWFSFCGSVTNPKATRVRASAAAVPADRLLIETDSPDFPPPGCPSPNEPANLIHVARAVADLRGVSADDIAQITFTNATELFGTI